MRSVISKSMLLGLTLVALSGCSSSGPTGSKSDGLGSVNMAITLRGS